MVGFEEEMNKQIGVSSVIEDILNPILNIPKKGMDMGMHRV